MFLWEISKCGWFWFDFKKYYISTEMYLYNSHSCFKIFYVIFNLKMQKAKETFSSFSLPESYLLHLRNH